MKREFECHRCGRCCQRLCYNFWVREGNYEKYPKLKKEADKIGKQLSTMRWGAACGKLEMRRDPKDRRRKIGVCLIEEEYGREAKPKICKEWGEKNLCQRARREQNESVFYRM